MRVIWTVATDLLREALARRWFIALFGALTLLLVGVAMALRLDVVDGALAATSLFGDAIFTNIQSVDVALRPLYQAVAYIVFYGGLVFGLVACSDFAPSLLAPGRIEHLLALPVRRWELLAGTFLGVLVLAVSAAAYGAGGLSLVIGVKTGWWTAGPLLSACLAAFAFASVYGAMLAAAVFVRSASLSTVVGTVVAVAGILASYRNQVAEAFSPGFARSAFEATSLFFPRIATVADMGATLAARGEADVVVLARLLGGMLAFAAATFALGAWRFEARDW